MKEIQYYKDRAVGLRSIHKTGQRRALELIRRSHPRFATATDDAIREAKISQEDAELVFAREHGFLDWISFCGHIESLTRGETIEPFMLAFEAMDQGDEPGFRALLGRHPDLANAQGTNGNSLLNLAVSMKQTTCAKALIDAGADVGLANNKGWTPLHQAAYGNRHDHAKQLIEAGASTDPEAHGEGGTPLVQALFWGNHEMADMLADHGVVPNNLRVAAGLGRLDLVRACFNTDGSLSSHAGECREFHRPHSGFPAWVPSDDRQEILDEALQWACRNGRTAVLQFLVERGADVNADSYRGTPLTWASFAGQIPTARWLLEHGADVNLKAIFGGPDHGKGVTALHIAA